MLYVTSAVKIEEGAKQPSPALTKRAASVVHPLPTMGAPPLRDATCIVPGGGPHWRRDGPDDSFKLRCARRARRAYVYVHAVPRLHSMCSVDSHRAGSIMRAPAPGGSNSHNSDRAHAVT
eukprot:COSAG02_NODE_31457_length_533_cov_0.875576_2_plen_119_part_01